MYNLNRVLFIFGFKHSSFFEYTFIGKIKMLTLITVLIIYSGIAMKIQVKVINAGTYGNVCQTTQIKMACPKEVAGEGKKWPKTMTVMSIMHMMSSNEMWKIKKYQNIQYIK